MKILILSYGYPPDHSGGYELRCKDIAGGLSERGHEIEIITSRWGDNSPAPVEPGVFRVFHEIRSFTPVSKMLCYSYQDIRFLDRKIKEFSPESIYLFHVINFTRYLYPYLAQLDIPVVYDEGGWGLTYAWCHHRWLSSSPIIYKKISKLAIRIIVQILSRGLLKARWAWPGTISAYFNNSNALQHAEDNRVPLLNRRVIYPAVDGEMFQSPPRSHLGNPVKILVPGRIESRKGVNDAIDCYLHLREKSICTQLLIVGKRAEAEYLDILMTRITELDYNDITILPQVSYQEMALLYRENDICFFPSYHHTGLSRVPLEAMASGCLVISYGGEASREIIQHGKTGFLVEPKDWDAIEEIVQKLITEPAMYQEVIQNALEYVQTNHNFTRYIDQIERFLLNAGRTQ